MKEFDFTDLIKDIPKALAGKERMLMQKQKELDKIEEVKALRKEKRKNKDSLGW